ncbi:MAG: SBBP repeat-containing protein [Phycisphaerales bacterium JB039]
MQHGEHLAGLTVIAAGIAVAPAAPAAAEEPCELMWARLLGTADDDYGRSVALDADGNVIICGSADGDVLLAKYTPSGTLLWSRQYGTTAADTARDVATDSACNIYLVGETRDSLFGPHAGSLDAFLAKYSPSGDLLWGHQFGTSASDHASAVIVDSEDHVYLCGDTDGPAGSDAFLAKYDSEGGRIWERQFAAGFENWATGLALDAAGDVVVAGHAGGDGAVLARFTASGEELWIRRIDTPDEQWFFDIALDATGNIYFAGQVFYPYSDEYSAVLMKTDAEGAMLWSRSYDHSSITGEVWSAVTVDTVGNAYVAGSYGPEWGYEGPVVMQLSKYGPSGDQLWLAEPTLGARTASASGVHADSAGNLFISGLADRLFGIPGAGGVDALVARFRPACYADCDGSGATDFFDFLCFQNLFAAGDARADCDDSGSLDLFDFLCFQNAFAAGCPG